MNKNIGRVCIQPRTSISTVLSLMALNKSQDTDLPAGIILVTDPSHRLVGIATDGDIRRGLSKGLSLADSISKVMNSDPFLIEGPKSPGEILSIISAKLKKEHWHKDRLNKIIIVDENKRPIDIVSFYDLWQKSDVCFKQIGVVGLGYVGLTLAVTLADVGFKVLGFEINPKVKHSLRKGKPHFFERGLEELLRDNLSKNFKVVDDFDGENNCDVYFIAVGTPLNKNKKPDLQFIRSAARFVGRVLKSGDAVILRSTVPVGTTRDVVIPVLEKASGLRSGDGFFAAFAPERTVEGMALEELRKLPQVIGGVNWASADLVANIFNHLTHSVVWVDSLEEAEMVKLVNNTYRDVTFAFANELSLVCNRFGISTHRIIEAANRGYERSNVPLPSPGVGGVCLEKDPFIFIDSAKKKNYEPKLVKQAREISAIMVDFLVGEIQKFLSLKGKKRRAKVAVLGLAFKGKPETSDIRGSTSVYLIEKLKKAGIRNINVFDPVVNRNEVNRLGVKYANDAKASFSGSDAVIVMNNNPVFENLNIRRFLGLARSTVLLFDAWGLYNEDEIKKVKGVTYRRL